MSLNLIEYLAKKTPLEEKIDALSDSFEKIVELFIKMAESFDFKVTSLDEKVSQLIENLNKVNIDFHAIKESSINPEKPLPPPNNPPTIPQKKTEPKKTGNVRRDLINELKHYFDKQQKGE